MPSVNRRRSLRFVITPAMVSLCPTPHQLGGFCDSNHMPTYGKTRPEAQPSSDNENCMKEFVILTNRKRAVIALVHSFVFLGIALAGFASRKTGIVHGLGPASDFILAMIYITVTSILVWLASISRCARERLYFALCASSATFGLLRTGFGDAAFPAAQYLRVIMLTSAVLVGTWIFRSFSRRAVENVLSD